MLKLICFETLYLKRKTTFFLKSLGQGGGPEPPFKGTPKYKERYRKKRACVKSIDDVTQHDRAVG